MKPIDVHFGEGFIKMNHFTTKEGVHGILFKDTGKPHPINVLEPSPPEEHFPEEGEIYFNFKNIEGAKALRDQVLELIEIMESPAPQREGEKA